MKLKSHLRERGMDPSKYSMYVSYSANKVTWLLWNMSGQLVGYQH